MATRSDVDLTVLIVSYRTRELTLACLDSVERTLSEGAQLRSEIVVLDNASDDGSAEAIRKRFPDVRLLEADENLGFARGNNVAAREARGRYLVLLNPDTIVGDGALQALVAFADAHPEVGIVGGRTTFEDGALNPASCWAKPTAWSTFCLGSGLASVFRRSALFHPESMGAWPRDSVRRVDIVSGCLLLVRRELWDALEGFDESFFMYGEDADLCLRAAALGWHCAITPKAEIVHLGGRSERVRVDKMVRLFRARAQLYRKHQTPRLANFCVRMLDLWAWTRAAALGALTTWRPSRSDARDTWLAIWNRRSEWNEPER